MKESNLGGIERLILGGLAAFPSHFAGIRDATRPEMFTSHIGRTIAEAMWSGLMRGRYLPENVAAQLPKNYTSELHQAREVALARLISREDIIEAADILRANWSNETYRAAMQTAIEKGDGVDWKEIDGVIEEARQTIAGAQRVQTRSREETLDDIVTDMFAGVTGQKTHHGIGTGFTDLDDLTGGWEPGQQIVIGGRPGMGKTRLAMGMALHAARNGDPVVFVSMEMTAAELWKLALSWATKIPVSVIRTYNYKSTADTDAVKQAADTMKNWPLYVIDNLRYAEDIEYAIRELHQRHGAKMVVIDYLQLMYQRNSRKNGNRNNELTEISAGLKGLAQELRFASIPLSQLSRGVDSRSNRRPVLADLRDSGAIEADADVVIFPHRENAEDTNCAAEIIVAKQRAGKLGTVECTWTSHGFYADGTPELQPVNGHAQPIAPAYIAEGDVPF
jgi:replicative DNA helicase